jgi:hypothetical protein
MNPSFEPPLNLYWRSVVLQTSQYYDYDDDVEQHEDGADLLIVDDNARMHKTESYYELAKQRRDSERSELSDSRLGGWNPAKDSVVGFANNSKNRWGQVSPQQQQKRNLLPPPLIDVHEEEKDEESSSDFQLAKPARQTSLEDMGDTFISSLECIECPKKPSRRSSIDLTFEEEEEDEEVSMDFQLLVSPSRGRSVEPVTSSSSASASAAAAISILSSPEECIESPKKPYRRSSTIEAEAFADMLDGMRHTPIVEKEDEGSSDSLMVMPSRRRSADSDFSFSGAIRSPEKCPSPKKPFRRTSIEVEEEESLPPPQDDDDVSRLESEDNANSSEELLGMQSPRASILKQNGFVLPSTNDDEERDTIGMPMMNHHSCGARGTIIMPSEDFTRKAPKHTNSFELAHRCYHRRSTILSKAIALGEELQSLSKAAAHDHTTARRRKFLTLQLQKQLHYGGSTKDLFSIEAEGMLAKSESEWGRISDALGISLS